MYERVRVHVRLSNPQVDSQLELLTDYGFGRGRGPLGGWASLSLRANRLSGFSGGRAGRRGQGGLADERPPLGDERWTFFVCLLGGAGQGPGVARRAVRRGRHLRS